ncbi:hypothetical protein SAMN05444487_101125 [Marininema mesophilum]|uniref:Virus attachment protein p12 family protein n=1 Tax=Marininema mesophilum TaxID=1048340 RepID=A0A1H2Q8T0_9BACL|nr:hypothetical protein [Marininema mesophilum]SDW02829.1 hypothetical protein SAMN05444487_101125 [Marininema mesophilum]
MIYLVIVGVLGFAAWQLIGFLRRLKSSGSGCAAGGCNSCPSNGGCSIQDWNFISEEAIQKSKIS